MYDSNSSRRKRGKNMLISKDDFDLCFYSCFGRLAIEVVRDKRSSEDFLLYVVGLRKYCGMTISGVAIASNCNIVTVNKLLSKYSSFTIQAAACYNGPFLERLKVLRSGCRALARRKTGYERLKKWRSKRPSNAYKNKWNAENRAVNATKKSKGRAKDEGPRLVQRRNVIKDNKDCGND